MLLYSMRALSFWLSGKQGEMANSAQLPCFALPNYNAINPVQGEVLGMAPTYHPVGKVRRQTCQSDLGRVSRYTPTPLPLSQGCQLRWQDPFAEVGVGGNMTGEYTPPMTLVPDARSNPLLQEHCVDGSSPMMSEQVSTLANRRPVFQVHCARARLGTPAAEPRDLP